MIHKFNPKNGKMNLDGGLREINRVVCRLIDAMQEELVNVYKDIDDKTENAIWEEFQSILSEEIGIVDYNNQMG